MAKKSQKNANYDFKNKAPAYPMGTGSFANLPPKPMMASFSKDASYRNGLMNGPVMGIDEMSEVDENGCR